MDWYMNKDALEEKSLRRARRMRAKIGRRGVSKRSADSRAHPAYWGTAPIAGAHNIL